MSTGGDDEKQAYDQMIELFNAVMSGLPGAEQALIHFIQETSNLPENDNLLTRFEKFLEDQQIDYLFYRNRVALIRTFHERTKNVLPPGRQILDMYRTHLQQLMSNNKGRLGSLTKGRKP